MARVIDQVLGATTSSVVGEITRELVNASDGAGLHFDGAAGNVSGTSNLALGSKYSAEFVLSYAGSANNRLFDINGDTRFIVEFNRTGFTGKIAGYDSDFYEICDIPDDGVFHLVVTVDGTAVSAYVNGNLAGTATKNNSTSIDTVTQWTIGANDGGSFGHFEGTIYRARFYNRTLSADDVRTAYERADVDYSSQYGSQTSLVDAGASVFTSGTYSWSAYGSNTIANVGNALEITYVNHAYGASNGLRDSSDLTTDLTVGKKYRLTVDAKYTGGSAGSKLQLSLAGSNTDFATLTTSLVTYTYEFTTDTAAGGGLRMSGMSAGNVVTIDNWYLREIGCVSDYDLAFASPTQSLTVQDRSTNNVDGTASSSTAVKQVQPVVQLNSTSARIGTFAATPADGQILADGKAKTAPSYSFGHTTATGMYSPGANQIRFSTASTDRLTIASDGAVSLGPGTAAVTTLKPSLLVTDTDVGGSITIRGQSPILAFDKEGSGTGTILTDGGGLNIKSGTLDSHGSTHLAISSTGDITSTNATGSKPILTLENTTNDANSSQLLFLKNRTATNNDNLGTVRFRGKNNAGTPEVVEYATIYAQSTNVAESEEDGKLIFRTMKDGNLAPRLTIASNGVAEFSNGIAFPAPTPASAGTPAASSVLDVYETGTWTPSLAPGGGSFTTLTYTTQRGKYIRVGSQVWVGFEITVNAFTIGSGVSYVVLNGLPFDRGAAEDQYGSGTVTQYSGWTNNAPVTLPRLNAGSCILRYATSSVDVANLPPANITAGCVMNGFMVYSV